MRLLSYLTLILMISCKANTDKSDLNYFSNLNFSLDTVIVDPGDEIIFLKYQLLSSDITKNRKYLLNFNEDDHTVEKINLDKLRLEEKYPFEKDGPNGTGSFIGRFDVYNENQIILTGLGRRELFSLDGQRLNTIHLENFSLNGEPLENIQQVKGPDTVTDRLYGLIYDDIDKRYAFGILNMDELEVSVLELENFDNLSNYEIIYNSNGIQVYYPAYVYLDCFGTKVVLSNQTTSSLVWYDTELDSLFMKLYNSQLTANGKTGIYKLEHKTDESFDVEYGRFLQEINFLPPFWDPDNQIFYRFSYQGIAVENWRDQDRKSKVYLTVLDKELNQIGETIVPQLTKKPAKHFTRDGKIWIYENINDEMGFVILTISE